jgi:hypothetical protein
MQKDLKLFALLAQHFALLEEEHRPQTLEATNLDA